MAKSYYGHMKDHPKTLIAKVIGIFKITFYLGPGPKEDRTETAEYNVIVMENIQLTPKLTINN